MKEKTPDLDPDKVIDRLIKERRQDHKLIAEIKEIAYSNPEFDGMTLTGALRAMRTGYQDAQDQVRALEKDINKFIKKG